MYNKKKTLTQEDARVLLNKTNNKWPAIILAVSRIAKVSGRIKFLIVSISTMNGIRINGVLCGIKWANKLLGLLIQPYVIKDTHIINDILIVRAMWLEEVKI